MRNRQRIGGLTISEPDRWVCTRRTCGCWSSMQRTEGPDPKCPLCGGVMRVGSDRGAEKHEQFYHHLFLMLSIAAIVALFVLFVVITFGPGGR